MKDTIILFLATILINVSAYAQVKENYLERGNESLDAGNFEQAIHYYNKAIEIDPDNLAAFFMRGTAYFLSGDHGRAIAEYNYVISLRPDVAMGHIFRGLVYFDVNDFKDAYLDFNKAVELEPVNAVARLQRARCSVILGNTEEAIIDYEQYIELVAQDNRKRRGAEVFLEKLTLFHERRMSNDKYLLFTGLNVNVTAKKRAAVIVTVWVSGEHWTIEVVPDYVELVGYFQQIGWQEETDLPNVKCLQFKGNLVLGDDGTAFSRDTFMHSVIDFMFDGKVASATYYLGKPSAVLDYEQVGFFDLQLIER